MKNWKALMCGLLVCVIPDAVFATPVELDKIVAVVNNDVVLESDISELSHLVKFNAQQDGRLLPDGHVSRHQLIEYCIMNNIQSHMAKKNGITVTNDDLDNAIANFAMQKKISVNQLYKRLSNEGIHYSHYRSYVHKEMLGAKVRNNEVSRRVVILPQEVDTLAKQLAAENSSEKEINISQIMLSLPKNPSQHQLVTVEALARQLMVKLHNGADFGELATRHSEDSQASKGGNIGWKKLQDIPTIFASHLVDTKKAAIIGPIRSGDGLYILKVNDMRYMSYPMSSITEIHARHILLKASAMMTDYQVQNKLTKVAQDIKSGRTNFADEAKQLSQDSDSVLRGGDLGWISLNVYDSTLRDALIKLNKGEISTPVHSVLGWHLIQLLDVRQADKTDIINTHHAYRMLFNRKFIEETQSWIQELRAQADVKIM